MGEEKPYIAQGINDTCCFVYAVANCLIYLDHIVPNLDLDRAKEVAACITGNTIFARDVVKHLNAPLEPTTDAGEVLKHGGVLNIWHPIFNGHSLFVYPDPRVKNAVYMINSWLGPNVMGGIGHSEIGKFIVSNCGEHWRIKK